MEQYTWLEFCNLPEKKKMEYIKSLFDYDNYGGCDTINEITFDQDSRQAMIKFDLVVVDEDKYIGLQGY